MWMQLVKLTLMTLFFCFIAPFCFSQNDSIQAKDTTAKKEAIEIYFLSSYYEQDGIHSPVTGGTGTEKLSNVAPTVYVHVPIDSLKSIDVNAGVDFYSSASSDNIDNPYLSENHVSGASANDIRQYYSFTYSKKNKKKNENSYNIGASSEYDVTSLSTSYTFNKKGKKNREFLIGAKYFFDDWKLIYPIELRNGTNELLSTDKRHTVGVTLSESFVVNRRLKGSVTSESVGQFGLLSTPFHRVYFSDQVLPEIENLPNMRLKFPVALRLNAYLGDNFVIRTFNRLYADNWGVKGYTFQVELPVKAGKALTISPIYRFHAQSAADYFGAFQTLSTDNVFRTSDFDLSGFTSHKYGLGMSIKPLFGLARIKQRNGSLFIWKRIDLRYVYYQRSDGLSAWNITAGLDFSLGRK